MKAWQQVNDPAAVSAIFVPVGGGGLIAGIAAYVKWIRPDIKVIGVEPTGGCMLLLGEEYPLVRGR